MQPIEKQVTDAFELVQLQNLWDAELKCQAHHRDERNLVCSGEVTHRHRNCEGVKAVCTNSAAFVEWALTFPDTTCRTCLEPVGAHWDVAPL